MMRGVRTFQLSFQTTYKQPAPKFSSPSLCFSLSLSLSLSLLLQTQCSLVAARLSMRRWRVDPAVFLLLKRCHPCLLPQQRDWYLPSLALHRPSCPHYLALQPPQTDHHSLHCPSLPSAGEHPRFKFFLLCQTLPMASVHPPDRPVCSLLSQTLLPMRTMEG